LVVTEDPESTRGVEAKAPSWLFRGRGRQSPAGSLLALDREADIATVSAEDERDGRTFGVGRAIAEPVK